MHKRRLTTVAVVAAAAITVVGCTQGAAPEAEPEVAELKTIEMMAPYFSEAPPEDDGAIELALEELTGVKIEMTWVPNAAYGEKTNTTLASDDVPHVMVIQGKTQSFVQTAEAGGFWDLTDILGDYPNLTTSNPEVQHASSVNGVVYGIYRARDVIRASVIIRQDWLDNLGLELPETTDDLYDIAQAFTEDDPDGNGVDDTTGIIVPKWPVAAIGTNSPWDAIEIWHGAGNVWTEEDGELIPSFTTDEWMEALKFERDLVANGYVNRDFATMDSATWNEPFLNGRGGIIIDVQSRAPQLADLFEATYPDDWEKYVWLAGNLTGPDGEDFAMPTAGYSGMLSISKAQVPTEAELRAVLEFLNTLNSPEAQVLMNNGIEDDNFVVEDGFAVFDPDKKPLTDTATAAWAQLGTNVNEYSAYLPKPNTDYDKELLEYRLELQAKDLENAVYNPAAAFVSPTYLSAGTQLDNIIGDARIQFIAGQIDEAGVEAAIELWRSTGGDAVTEEINELYKASK